MDTNVAVLSGRLTRDCELKYTSGGTAVLSGSIAVDERIKRGDEWNNAVSFFDFAVFGKTAEGVKPYTTKGRQVVISGCLKQERWTAQDGSARNRVTIIVHNLQLVGGNNQAGTQTGGQHSQYQQQDQPYNPYNGGEFPEDITF